MLSFAAAGSPGLKNMDLEYAASVSIWAQRMRWITEAETGITWIAMTM
jgi:hypothetical protein